MRAAVAPLILLTACQREAPANHQAAAPAPKAQPPASMPGMDMPGKEPYDVLLLDSAGKATVFARH